MSVITKVTVTCPDCKAEHQLELARSLNTREQPELKAKLLAGTLNLLQCGACGRRAPLEGDFLFHDPDRQYFCQVVPGGELKMEKAARDFTHSGATGTLRLVPSMNALVEKVTLNDAGLDDWVVELAKVLLLSSLPEHDLNQVLLFDAVDREAKLVRWVLPGAPRGTPPVLHSALDKLVESTGHWSSLSPGKGELRIDRLWAVTALSKVAQA